MAFRPELGVNIDDLGLSPKEGLRRAAALSFRGVEASATAGDLTPANLSQSGRRHLQRFIEGLGLKLKALSADIPGLRLTDPGGVEERVDRTCQILDLSRELGVPVVTASVGALTHPESGDPSPIAVAALKRIGEFADSRGLVYAVRPSHDGVDRVARLLDEIRCPAIRIGLDPAAMIMSGVNPQAWLERDPESVCLVHARDGTQGTADRAGREALIGGGEVDWFGLLAMLREADYQGGFLLRRTDSASPERDLLLGRDALNAMLHSLQR